MAATFPREVALAELHCHIGGAVDPPTMWSIAHSQGIRLPTRSYWDFVDLITVDGQRVKTFEQYLQLFHWTELIQSSPDAMERAVYEIIGGAYRKNNIDVLELRFNPMKRNRGGERDLDHIIAASARGMERATLDYPVVAGLILCLDTKFDYEVNDVIVRKALAHRSRGVVGIDIAGSEPPDFPFATYERLFAEARDGGLGITVHAGESGSAEAMREAIVTLRPDRVGHGVKAASDQGLLELIVERDILLEICPSSNLSTGVISSIVELASTLEAFRGHGVKFSLNTDGPEMLQRQLRQEIDWLLARGLLRLEDVLQCNRWAREKSFIRAVCH
ncbi:MAG: adenosine deaminase [Chloroflexi bacterium]|nr:adenosine deaminase [Chloroflexota bacterium]